MPESKEIRNALSKCRARALEAERQLMMESPDVLADRAYLRPGTAERGGYNVGYLAALKDVMSMLEGGEMPGALRPTTCRLPTRKP